MKKIIFLFVALLSLLVAQAQVNVSIAIAPPYSTRISDYANNPGKVVLTLTYTAGAVGGSMKVLLRATVTGDNGIVLATKNNYKPPVPLELQPNIPKVVDIQTIRELFDANSFTVQGTTSRDIFDKGGLPEGNYQFCVRAFLYDNPNVAVSSATPSGCTFVRLTQLDPPILIKPFDKEIVANNGIQNIIFSWNIAPGAEPSTQYLFRLIEMLDSTKNQNDAMNARTTPSFYETVVTNNILLYGPAQPLLVSGRKYAWAVTALQGRTGTAYKNNGRSEVRSFVMAANTTPLQKTEKISFILPNKKQSVFQVNHAKPMLVSWNWFNDTVKSDTIQLNDTLYKKLGVVKYMVNIEGLKTPLRDQLTNKNFRKSYTINLDNNTLKSNLQLNKNELLSAGFQDNYWYNVTVEAYDAQNKLVSKEKSVDFKLSMLTEEQQPLIAHVKAQLKYKFYGKSALYNAANTPVEVNILTAVKNSPPSFVLPQVTVNGLKYYVLGSVKDNTNKDAFINTLVYYSAPLADNDVFVQLKSLNGYYLLDSVPLVKLAIEKDTSTAIIGQVIANTYGYSLQVNVQKFYPAYHIQQTSNGQLSFTPDTVNPKKQYAFDKDKGMYYNTNLSKPLAGINVLLFRKNKQSYVPPIEGNLTVTENKQGFVVVAEGTTKIIQEMGKEVAVVQFDNLLANLYAGDEYFLVVPDGNNFKYTNGKNTVLINGKEVPITSSSAISEEFFAEEKMIKVPAPKTFFGIVLKDSLYRLIKTNYHITSKKPPTSLVKGRLMYKWNSDKKGILRPYANQSFKIVVDYLADKASIGAAVNNTSNSKEIGYSEKFFVPDNSTNTNNGMQLLDFGQTMAIGKTDAQGNFEIEVINVNPKGNIGKGKIVEKGWSVNNPSGIKNEKDPATNIGGGIVKQEVINPGDNFTNGLASGNWVGNHQMPGGSIGLGLTNSINNAAQGFINNSSKTSFFNTQTGFTEITTKQMGNVGAKNFGLPSNGPNVSVETIAKDVVNDFEENSVTSANNSVVDVNSFERVFRIVPSNIHLSQGETFIVNPFNAADIGNQITTVKELTLKVIAKEKNTLLSGIKVTVFRRLQDKNATIPIGEGDGLYVQKKLINPQYTGNDATYGMYTSNLDKDNIYNTVFEHLWSGQVTGNDGSVSLPSLLAGYSYYIQACSDPTQGTNFYQSYFTTSNNNQTLTVNLTPSSSRVFIRVLDNSNQQPIPFARVAVTSQSMLTDDKGYAEIKVTDFMLKDLVTKDNDAVTLYISAEGYSQDSRKVTFAKLQGFQQSLNITLQPGKTISGKIVSADEKGTSVSAYIKLANGSLVETNAQGVFSIPVPNKDNIELEVIPKDLAYFDTSFIISKAITNLNDIKVYRRKHRVRLVVQDAAGKALNNATAELAGMVKQSNGWGIADFVFENVSVNNYTCIVRGPQSDSYVPIAINIKNSESKDFIYYTVKLEKGSEITGTVSLDGKPVKNAKVYLQYNAQLFSLGNSTLNSNVNLNTAYTNELGVYSLKGVPVNNKDVSVNAVLDTSFTVVGENKNASIANHKAVVNFNLARYTNMQITHLMGFPLTIEQIEPTGKNDEVLVTGTIKWDKANSGFTWLQGTDVLRVNKVAFKSTMIGSVKVGVPTANTVPIEGLTSIKLSYLNKYNVNLFTDNLQQNGLMIPKELTLTTKNDYGVIEGFIKIVDNSFNYPSTYLNFSNKEQFYLADVSGNSVITKISAVKSATSITNANKAAAESLDKFRQLVKANIFSVSTNQRIYNLADKDGTDIAFKFLQFNATADAKKSYIAKDGKIHLNVNMQCNIKNATPEKFTVNINDVVLDDNNVYPAAGSNPINLQLEKWTLQVNDWKLDAKEGGIVSNNGLIKTQAVDIPFQKFALRSNMFVMDSFNLKSLMLGGGVHPLSNINAANAALVYDLKTGSDMQPHWRFSLSSSGTPVANINNLPGLSRAVKLNYLQTLSNNETVMQLMQETNPHIINNHSKAQFSPEVITNGKDFFDIYGSLNMNIPRVGAVGLTLNYSKPQSTLQMKLKKASVDFQTKGFVHFYTPQQADDNIANISIDNNTIQVKGRVVEKPIKSFNDIDAELLVTNNNTEIVLPKGYVMQLNSNSNASTTDGYKLTLTNGGTKVINGDWDIFSYTGIMQSNSTSADKGIDDAKLTFKVLGDVAVNGDGMKLSGVSTPFGEMNMSFDFAQKRLLGTLQVKDVLLGTNTVNGTIETVFDPQGFYIAGGGSIDVLGIHPIVDGKYNLGIMLGSYPLQSTTDHLWQVVTAYKQPEVVNNCYITNIIKPSGNKLKGFYFTIDRTIIDKSIDFDFVLASGYVRAKALLGADVYANFSNGLSLGFGAVAYAHAAAGMSALTGTSLSGSFTAKGRIDAFKNQTGFNISANVGLSFKAKIVQSLMVTTVSKEISIGASAKCKNASSFSFDLNDGELVEDCQ